MTSAKCWIVPARTWPALWCTLGIIGRMAPGQVCPTWTRENALPRSDYALAFDDARGMTVMFGGRGADGLLRGDTWEWDGASWSARAASGPPASANCGMVFDQARGVCLLLVNSQTWHWDGSAWTQQASVGPVPERTGFKLTYEPFTGRTILFGGALWQGGAWAYPDDTWAWNGEQWTQVATFGPQGRRLPGMTFDAQRSRIVLHGGRVSTATDGLEYVNDTWEWDGARWQEQPVTGPRPRWAMGMAYSAARRAVILHGGAFDGYDSGTWAYDGAAWTLLPVTGPASRAFHSLVEDTHRNTLLCFGGYDGNTTLGDTPELIVASGQPQWIVHATGGAPARRDGAAMAFDRTRNVHVLYGGGIPGPFNAVWYGDTWEWDGARWQLVADAGPSPRTEAAIAFDESRNVTVLFGGSGTSSSLLGDTWEWDGRAWTLRSTTGPSPRYGATLTYHEGLRACVLLGGQADGDVSAELWKWDGTTWTLLSDGPIFGLSEHAVAFDRRRNVLVVHDGLNVGATWEWTESSGWIQRIGFNGTYRRRHHQLIYDERQGAVFSLFGVDGQNQATDDVWRWNPDAAQWSLASAGGPPARTRHVATYDAGAGHVLVFGGNTSYNNVLSDTWSIALDGLPSVEALSGTIFAWANTSLSLSSRASGAEPYQYQWLRDGRALTDGGNISGATTAVLTFDPTLPTDEAVYRVRVTNPCGSILSATAYLRVVQPGDADGDLDVDIDDVLAVIAHWGACPPQPPCTGDVAPLGGNGVVDIDDLLLVIANWSA